MLQTIIFITGAAILALELLSSRILTPYFGVSLYIWSGILSITLVSLALGYWWGGRLTGGKKTGAQIDRLAFLFALMPAVASLAIVAACLVYPYLFYALARLDLVFGAFVACLVLLFVPLVATSAMNPLLVALLLRHSAARGELADAGAGRVFFISTLGSVAGVLATAFGLIPNFSNFDAALLIAAILAALPLAMLRGKATRVATPRTVTATALVALAASLGLLAMGDAYINRMWPAQYGGLNWTPEASYRSLFGTVKVLKSDAEENGDFVRIYFQDGLTQNMVDSGNRSQSLFSYALEALARAYRPQLKSTLVLGIGAGMVPMRLAGLGVDVTAIDINAASIRAATEVFGLDRSRVHVQQADARTFLRQCNGAYDVVVVDLFQGDGVPDYLVTRDFFHDLKRCLGAQGVAVFNTFAHLDYPRPYAHLLATLRSELPFLVLYRPDYGSARHLNSFIVASANALPAPVGVDMSHVPQDYYYTLSAMLKEPLPLNQDLLAGGRVITDASNPVTADFAEVQLVNRRNVIEAVPAAFFAN